MDVRKAIEVIGSHRFDITKPETLEFERALYVAVETMQELQQYRQIGTLEECRGYKIHSQAISKMKSCNDCGSRGGCSLRPAWGEFCRINCAFWKGE